MHRSLWTVQVLVQHFWICIVSAYIINEGFLKQFLAPGLHVV